MKRLAFVFFTLLLFLTLSWSPLHAAAPITSETVSSTNQPDAFPAASRHHVHHAAGCAWVAFHDGTSPVLYFRTGTSGWTEADTGLADNHLFTTPDPLPGFWGAKFSGTELYLAGTGSSMVYFEHYTLQAGGVVVRDTLRDETVGSDGSNYEANVALTATGGVRVFWRYDPRIYFFAANSDQTVWADRYKSGYITQVNSLWPFALPLGVGNDLIMIAADDPSVHELRAMPYADATDTWGASELLANNLCPVGNPPYAQVIAAVKTSNGNIHLVYGDTNGRMHHLIRTGDEGGAPWQYSGLISDDTGCKRLTLSTDGERLWAFYALADHRIQYKVFNGSDWSPVEILKDDTTPLVGVMASAEQAGDYTIGVSWLQGSATPYAIQYAAIQLPTPTATATPSDTATPDPTPQPTATPEALPAPGLTVVRKLVHASRGEAPELIAQLRKPGRLVIRIYDLNGKQVAKLADRDYPAGTHRLTWNIQGVGSGTYWIRFESPEQNKKEKIVIVR